MFPENLTGIVQQTVDAYADVNYTPSPAGTSICVAQTPSAQDPALIVALSRRNLKYRSPHWLSPKAWCLLMTKATPQGYKSFLPTNALDWILNAQKETHSVGTLLIQPARESGVVAYVKGPTELLEVLLAEGRQGAAGILVAEWEKRGQIIRLEWD